MVIELQDRVAALERQAEERNRQLAAKDREITGLKSKLASTERLGSEQLGSDVTPVPETARQSFNFDFVQSTKFAGAAVMAVPGASQPHGQYGTWPPDQADQYQIVARLEWMGTDPSRITTDGIIEAASRVSWLGPRFCLPGLSEVCGVACSKRESKIVGSYPSPYVC